MLRTWHGLTHWAQREHRGAIAHLLALVAVLTILTATTAQAAPAGAGGQNLGASDGHAAAGFGKSQLMQDPKWVARKLAYTIQRPGYSSTSASTTVPACASPCPPASDVLNYSPPTSDVLSYSVTQTVREPLGNAPGTNNCTYDAGGHCYVDKYMWGLCGPGATAVTLYYWNGLITSYSNGEWFSDPHTSTYWNNTDGRAYMMYLATQVDPPSFIAPGEETYETYPSDITYNTDVRDTLNWEASGHASNWSAWFYVYVSYSGLSASTLRNDIMTDVWNDLVPVVVDVNAQLLPDWNNNGGVTSHFVTVIGYNNSNNTYTYIDTCGVGCNNKGSANGVYTVSQTTLYNAIEQNNGNGALVW